MAKQQIEVFADPETKDRIERAAAKHNMAVGEYCLNAIRQQLADDELLESGKMETQGNLTKKKPSVVIANLRALHEEILAYRNGQLIDIDNDLEQMREERDHELSGLR